MLGKTERKYSINKRLSELNKERMEVLVDYQSLNNNKSLGERFPMQVLVVDDQVINRKVMSSQLKKLGYHAVLVENGLQAYEAFQSQYFDLIFMDIDMPVMDGVDATQRIFKMSPDKPPYIVAYTTRCSDEEIEVYKKIGIDHLLTKPASVHNVVDVIQLAIKKILVEV